MCRYIMDISTNGVLNNVWRSTLEKYFDELKRSGYVMSVNLTQKKST
jgi:hypothetical protein